MQTNELVRLVEAGDLHGAMMKMVKAWAERYYAGSLGAALYVWVDEFLPPVRITLPA